MDILGAKALLKNVSIGVRSVEEKVKYVPTELPTLGSTGIVPMQLVSSVDPCHVLVVQQNCFRTADESASVVLLSPLLQMMVGHW